MTGIILTKLDGTAKGGIVFAIARELGVPVRFVGTGESWTTSPSSMPQAFVDSLFERVEIASGQRVHEAHGSTSLE